MASYSADLNQSENDCDLVTSIVLVIFMLPLLILFSFNLVADHFMNPKEPIIRLESFSATVFNISGRVMEATWEASVTVENPNSKFEAYFREIQNLVYYKEPVNSLARGLKESLSMETKSNKTITMKSSMSDKSQPERWVVDDIEKERKGGSVSLGLGFCLVGKFTWGSGLFGHDYHRKIPVSCGDIKVEFAAGSNTGALAIGDKPRECSLYTESNVCRY